MDIKEVGHHYNTTTIRHPWELARSEIVLDIVKKNSSNIENTTVLDIGCGDTFLIENFADMFPAVDFIAVDTAFDSESIKRYEVGLSGKRVKLFNSLDKAKLEIKSEVSAIFLFDVVEHVDDDYSFLKNLSAQPFITERTRIFITVPAFQVLFTSHDLFLGHTKRYTNSTLTKLVQDVGFTPLKTGYFFSTLLIARSVQSVKEKFLGVPENNATHVAKWRGGRTITAFITLVLMIDYRVSIFFNKFGIKLIGLSNYIVCKKSA